MSDYRKFTGRIGKTIFDTQYSYEEQNKTPKGAPNVLYILLDDLGFAGLHSYGSTIDTPNIDRLADEGLRYNNFHTTAVCSATRASLLTGANPHEAGIGSLAEMVTGCENAIGHLNPEYATIAEILKEYDYNTYLAGKWHLSNNQTPSGPYNEWPLAKGFDRYYGYLKAETDHYHPQLVRDNSFVEQPKSYAEGYHVTEDITDNAIDFIFQHVNSYPDKPFFLYAAYGAVHAPHHVPKEYIERYKGKFDEGWDVIRQRWFENQKKIGIIPNDAQLTDRAPYVTAWDELDEGRKKLFARYMEVFAATLTYTDGQIGRLIDYLESVNQLDNTVVVFMSDNGSSPEGGRDGRFNRCTGVDITKESLDEVKFGLEHIDEIGGEFSFPQYPSGWSNVLNTPFQWYKYFTHEGGVKDPLIIRYPAIIKDPGGVRGQYHHISDITPTILDIIGVKKPEYIKGVAQKDFTGISLKYSLENSDAADRKTVQHYELIGNRAIYKDGWKAIANHNFQYDGDYGKDVWELYHVAADYSEKYNLADKYPDKLRELQDEFLIQAGRHNVFPMLKVSPVAGGDPFGDIVKPPRQRDYYNIFKPYWITESSGLSFEKENHNVSFELDRKQGDDGVLISLGSRFGGFTFYIKNDKLKYVENANEVKYTYIESEQQVPAGKVTVGYEYEYNDNDTADVRIYINKKLVGQKHIPLLSFMSDCFSYPVIRANYYTSVSPEYEVPFEFTGDILKVHIECKGTKVSISDMIDKNMQSD